jgi:sugar lactone lactonase YvrE
MVVLVLVGVLSAGCARETSRSGSRSPEPVATAQSERPVARSELRLVGRWWLELPRGARFDASGLCLTPSGELLVVADRGPQIYRLEIPREGDTAGLSLVAGDLATAGPTLRKLASSGRLDCEGIATDAQGRIFLCEESRRLVMRLAAGGEDVELLNLDVTSVADRFSGTDRNASFEGIGVGGGRLYLANERNPPLIMSWDLGTGQFRDAWVAEPVRRGFGPIHYSDLSWYDGRLFVLLRHQRAILEWDPDQRRVVAQYDYGVIEGTRELRYVRRYPTGLMEGLAVDAEGFWLVSDNNGESRVAVAGDRRPILLRLVRSSAQGSKEGGSPIADSR